MLSTQNRVNTNLLPSIYARTLTAIKQITPLYLAVSLNEIQEYALQDRVDTKYLVRMSDLPSLLSGFTSDCAILEVGSQRISEYRTLYFDTPALNFYYDHHNGKRPRYKIRMREYHSTKDAFLEIKKKENDLRTIKNRMPIADIRQSFTPEMRSFLEYYYPGATEPLQPILWNTFKRITLINTCICERLTIDLGLNFFNKTNSLQLFHLAVVELKQITFSRESIIHLALKEKGYQPIALSKYCTGVAFLNPDIKRNRFKQNFLQFKASSKRIYKNVNVFPLHA
ncbi:MAG: polyphosphate polymerase domain-containing protein [Anaerolineaceae bacterium]